MATGPSTVGAMMLLSLLLACAPEEGLSVGVDTSPPEDTAPWFEEPYLWVLHDDGTVPAEGELPRVPLVIGPTVERFVAPAFRVGSPVVGVEVELRGAVRPGTEPDFVIPSFVGVALVDDDHDPVAMMDVDDVRFYAERGPVEEMCRLRGSEATLEVTATARPGDTGAVPWPEVVITQRVQLVTTDWLDAPCAELGL